MAFPDVAGGGGASLADAGVTSLADLAEGVSIGVAPPAVAGVVSLADTKVTSLADAGMASLADSAQVVSTADFAESVAVGVTFLADTVGVVTKEMTVWDGRGALDGSDCGDCCDGNRGYRNDEDPGDWGGCPDGMLLADPVGVITGEMTFQEEYDVIGGSVYEYDDYCDCGPDYCDCGPDYCDCSPDYCDYDGPEDFGHCPDVYGFVGQDEYGLCPDFHDPGDCEVCCVSRGKCRCAAYPGIAYEEDWPVRWAEQ